MSKVNKAAQIEFIKTSIYQSGGRKHLLQSSKKEHVENIMQKYGIKRKLAAEIYDICINEISD